MSDNMNEKSSLEIVLSELADWSRKYRETVDHPPVEGMILKSIEGEAILIVELQEGKPPFIYGKAYVPELTDIEPAWYLENDNHKFYHGWKCILMSKARAEVLKKCELNATIKVKSLKVVKQSQSGKSLLCEVHEYA